MCPTCQSMQSPAASRRRKTLAELGGSFHCSVIGTCLSMTDLVRLGRKTGLALPAGATEHEIHAAFVAAAEEPKTGRILSKALDARFRQSIHRFRQAHSEEELRQLWQEARMNGRIAGGYWALLTHPLSSGKLRREAHGEIHMLSHELVREQQRDRRLLQELRQENLRLQEELLLRREEQQQAAKEHREEISALTARLQQAESLASVHLQTARELEELKTASGLVLLRERLRKLERMLAVRVRESEARQREIARLKEERGRLLAHKVRSNEDIRRLETEPALPLSTLTPPGCLDCKDHQTPECPGLNLCGRKILYVGGVNRLVPRYREVIEKIGGTFFHHDGGKEESKKRLPQLLCQADAVFCPIDCVSHDACLCAKKFCKRQAKPFVLMRSSSLSALSAGLKQLA